MLVINGNRSRMSGAERAVIDWLRASQIRGLALSGCHIPDERHNRAVEADLVLLTPHTLAAIEVKGILERNIDGTLQCGINRRWQLPGITGDPIHVRDNDTNPLEQVAGPMFGLKAVAEKALPDVRTFVAGLVLVEPNGGHITLDKGLMPTGRDVLLGGTADGLTTWLADRGHLDDFWTADRVLAMLTALGVDTAGITLQALAAEGFSVDESAVHNVPTTAVNAAAQPAAPEADNAAVVGLWDHLPPSSRPAAAQQPITVPSAAKADLGRTPGSVADSAIPPIPADTFAGRAGAGPSRPVRAVLLASSAAVLFGGGFWVLAQAHTTASPHQTSIPSPEFLPSALRPTTTTAPATTESAVAIEPEQQATVAALPPARIVLVLPPAAHPCYPLEAGC